jgi:NAD+ kinase
LDGFLMKQKKFFRIGLMGRHVIDHVGETLTALISYLKQMKRTIVLEKETADLFEIENTDIVSAEHLKECCDLIIVVGGDGSFLNAGRIACDQGLPILGINRGHLGFLTDIKPTHLTEIGEVLEGQYSKEERFLLSMELYDQKDRILHLNALNDVVLSPGQSTHLTRFQVFLDDEFVCDQRADGMIVATPTGSTAHALSGGGPILHPGLDVMVLVPMQPHTLSSRPIVVSAKQTVELRISSENEHGPYLTCDGQGRWMAPCGSRILIRKKDKQLALIHPHSYCYFKTLREKLNWEG